MSSILELVELYEDEKNNLKELKKLLQRQELNRAEDYKSWYCKKLRSNIKLSMSRLEEIKKSLNTMGQC